MIKKIFSQFKGGAVRPKLGTFPFFYFEGFPKEKTCLSDTDHNSLAQQCPAKLSARRLVAASVQRQKETEGGCVYLIEVSTNLCEVSQWLEKTPNRDIFLLKAPTSAFTMKYLSRRYAKLTFTHGR